MSAGGEQPLAEASRLACHRDANARTGTPHDGASPPRPARLAATPGLLILVLALAACGRTGLVEYPVFGAGGGTALDAGAGGGGGPECPRLAGVKHSVRLLEGNARHARFGAPGLLVVTEPGREAFRIELPALTTQRVATDVDDAEWLGEAGAVLLVRGGGTSSALSLLDANGERALVEATCAHVASSDGTVLFAVTSCSASWQGTLVRVHVPTGERTVVASNVSAFSLGLRGERLITAVGGGTDPTCFWGTSRCELRTLSGGLVTTSSFGCHHPVLTRRGDVLALRQAPGCADVTTQDVLVRRSVGAAFTLLAQRISPGSETRWDLDLSPDHDVLLAQRRSASGASLLAIAVGSGVERVLSRSALPVDVADPDLPLRRFTTSGDHVAFLAQTSTDPAVNVVTKAGDDEHPLAPGPLGLLASWPTEEALVLGARQALSFADLGSDRVTELFRSPGEVSLVGVTPDGRGTVLLDAAPGGGVTLRFVSRDGVPVELGGWNQSHLTSPVVDDEGCGVVFDTDRGGGGTWLVRLP